EELHGIAQPVKPQVDVGGGGVAHDVRQRLLGALVHQQGHRQGDLLGLEAVDVQVHVDVGLRLEGPHVAVQCACQVGAVQCAPAEVPDGCPDVPDRPCDLL